MFYMLRQINNCHVNLANVDIIGWSKAKTGTLTSKNRLDVSNYIVTSTVHNDLEPTIVTKEKHSELPSMNKNVNSFIEQ